MLARAESIPARGRLGNSSTAPVERALFHRARSTSSGRLLFIFSHLSIIYVMLLTAPIEGAPFHRAHSGSSEEHPAVASFLSFPTSPSTQSGEYPEKRVTGLPFTARVQRGPSEAARCASKKDNRLPATSSSAHPSTPLPPSPSAAPRPLLVQAPSQPPTDVEETLRQRPSCAPHLF